MTQSDFTQWASDSAPEEPDEGPEPEDEPEEPADDLDGGLEIPVQSATLSAGAARALAAAASSDDPPWDPLACPWCLVRGWEDRRYSAGGQS